MLVSRIENCMDRILEGVDTGDVRLILESTNEFKAAYETLDASVKEFAKVIGDAGLEGLKEPYVQLVKDLDFVKGKINSVSDKFSYEDQMKLLKNKSEDVPPEAKLTIAAMNHDTNVNAVKDAIIAIATWLEKNAKGIFTIGTQGVQMDPKFQECLQSSTPFSLGMFALAKDDATKNALLHNLVGMEYGRQSADEDEQQLADLKEKWKPFYNPDGKEEGEEANRWKEFKELIFGLCSGAEGAWKEAGKAIQAGKPSPEFQNQVKGFSEGLQSFVGGLFKGDSKGKIQPEKVMGSKPEAEDGMLMMEFEKFSALVVKLLEMSKKAAEVAEQSGEAVQAQEEATKPSEEVEEYKKKLQDLFDESDDQINNEKSVVMNLLKNLQEILGKPPTEELVSKIEDLGTKLQDIYNDDQKVQDIMKKLGSDTEEGEGEEENTDDVDGIKAFLKEKLQPDDLENMIKDLMDNNLMDETGKITPTGDSGKEETIDNIIEITGSDLSDDDRNELKSKLYVGSFEGYKLKKGSRELSTDLNGWVQGSAGEVIEDVLADMGLIVYEKLDRMSKEEFKKKIAASIENVRKKYPPSTKGGTPKNDKKRAILNYLEYAVSGKASNGKKYPKKVNKDLDGIIDWIQQKLKYELLGEQRTYQRWAKLAGIIKG